MPLQQNSMRAALIGLVPPGEGAAPEIGGRLVSRRQAEFALQCKCELILAHGHGATAEALALRHFVESTGARFQIIATVHALPAAIGPGDSLLVLQPGLLPEAVEAIGLLAQGAAVLEFSAGAGAPAGFERIDLTRAWAGAMIVPGEVLAQVDTLPPDCAPASALLRLALQARIAEQRLPDALIDQGAWTILPDAALAEEFEPEWFRRHLGQVQASAPSRLLAVLALRRWGSDLLRQPQRQALLLLATALLVGGALLAAWFGQAVAAFVLLGLAAPVVAGVGEIKRLAAAPFGSAGRWRRLRHVLDIGLVLGGVMALDGPWYRQLFAPLVIGASLGLLDREARPALAMPLRDRGVIAALAAIALALLPAEPALALLALGLLAATLLPGAGEAGITQD